MPGWTPAFESDLTQLLKDWLKNQGRTQADLRRSLHAVSARMKSLLEVLERDYNSRGLSGLGFRLCKVEAEWHSEGRPFDQTSGEATSDPFRQLDLLLQEIRRDCSG
ncbi:hypothetical protein [Synechococcus sp. M16CYN]|uniref:hypothetical protein n=1 Tax=Synechococcus sp. M16CYN TaxID=3103139 RepID=UPI0030E28F08